ncbi:MAG: copper-translocating P-type ATPase [Gammaproteobacteria bacterium]|nr:copper-translocating P-type ATPase [Gammaproteobacteria bacterium]
MVATAAARKRVSIDIQGMTCGACVARLERAFNRADGIDKANVNLPLEKATLVVDPTIIAFDDLRSIVERTGFDVGTQSRIYFIEGMTAPGHARLVEEALFNVPGVLSVDVNYAEERVQVTFVTRSLVDSALVEAISNVGFVLQIPTESTTNTRDAERADDREKLLLIVACLICIPFLVQMFAQFFGWQEIHMMPAAEVVLASILQLVVGARFYRAAYNALRGGSANMDVLVVLGTSSAYLYSWYLMLQLGEAAEGEMYFEAAALILTFILLGKRLESRAKRATMVAVRELMDLRPRTARLRDKKGQWHERPIDELALGSVFEVRPGDRIPADGLILVGKTTVDEALLTGESAAVPKTVGDMVFEGSINVDGRVEVETTALGEDGTLHQIVEAIENAQTGKIAVQRLVDRVSGIFVPVVIGIAVVVFGTWLFVGSDLGTSLINAVSVLVIACPCALGLATPTAIITGTGAAARAGILYKDIQCVEEAQRISVIAFDKTGTLTTASPTLEEVTILSSLSESRALQIAASIQANSTHPIAEAFTSAAQSRDVTLVTTTDFLNHVAEGVEARIDDTRYFVGNVRLAERLGVPIDESLAPEDILLFDESALLASFGIEDTVRPGARRAIALLDDLGVRSCMLSGDSTEKAAEVANRLGISEFLAELTPEDKVSAVERLSEKNEVVAMVGDGINDAPALARANVGIAMSSGTDVSLEVAPITLMRNDLNLVGAAIQASRSTFRKIKQNLFWAFIYNVVMLPLAAFGILTPTIAGAAMALSSVSVVCNSLWLRAWKPEVDKHESDH